MLGPDESFSSDNLVVLIWFEACERVERIDLLMKFVRREKRVREETRNTFDHVLKGLLDDKNQIMNRSGWEVSDRLTRTRSFRTDSFPAILPNRLFPYRAVSEGVLLSQEGMHVQSR